VETSGLISLNESNLGRGDTVHPSDPNKPHGGSAQTNYETIKAHGDQGVNTD